MSCERGPYYRRSYMTAREVRQYGWWLPGSKQRTHKRARHLAKQPHWKWIKADRDGSDVPF